MLKRLFWNLASALVVEGLSHDAMIAPVAHLVTRNCRRVVLVLSAFDSVAARAMPLALRLSRMAAFQLGAVAFIYSRGL